MSIILGVAQTLVAGSGYCIVVSQCGGPFVSVALEDVSCEEETKSLCENGCNLI